MTYRVVGKIVGYHGIKGEIKVLPLINHAEDFLDFESVRIAQRDYKILTIRVHKNNILLSLENIPDRTAAEALSGFVEAMMDEELADDEVYIEDLLGYDVLDQQKKIGTVKNFSEGSQELLVIELLPEFQAKRELLVPFVEEYIVELNKEAKYIRINLQNDLLELSQ